MHDEQIYLVPREARQEEDEQHLNLEAEQRESMRTGYYEHKIARPDDNSMTQVAYFIIMLNNVALHDEMLLEEEMGNTVISSNYDSIVLTLPPMLPTSGELGKWKLHHVYPKYRQLGKRSSKWDGGENRPGVRKYDSS